MAPGARALEVCQELPGGDLVVPSDRVLVASDPRVLNDSNNESPRSPNNSIVNVVVNNAGAILDLLLFYFKEGDSFSDCVVIYRWSRQNGEAHSHLLFVILIPEDRTHQVVNAHLRIVGDGVHDLAESSANSDDISIARLACDNLEVIERALEKERDYF